MSEASNVAVAFQDLTDALEALSSGSASPVAVRRNFVTFVDLSQKLTSYMRIEYSEKNGQTWVPSDFDGWNDVTELFKDIRNVDQHEHPIFILINATHYLRIFEDAPELVVSGPWALSLEDQHLDIPRDDIIFELGDLSGLYIRNIIPDDMGIPLPEHLAYRGGAMQTFTLTRTSPFGDSPKFAPECGWWHHGSGRKIDPPPEKRVRKE